MSEGNQADQPTSFARSQRRIENVQLLVSTAILTAYFGFSPTDSLPNVLLSHAINAAAIFSGLFLFIKLSIITIYPYQRYYAETDGSYHVLLGIFGRLYPDKLPSLKRLDRTVLPIIYVLFIWSSPIAALLAYLPEISGLGSLDVPSFLLQNSGKIYLLIFIQTLIPLASRYQTAYSQTMAHLETASTSKTILMGSGGSSAQATIEVSNPNDDSPLPAGDIRFLVNSPEGIDVTIGQSIPVEDDIWEPHRDVPAGEALLLPVVFDQTPEWDSISEDVVEVTVQFQGDYEVVEKYNVRG